MTTTTLPDIESLSFKIEQEMRVKAPIDVTFAALLEQLGPGFEKHDGEPAFQTRSVARRPLVPRPGRQQRPLLGHCAGHQAAHAARVLRPADDVARCRQQRAVQAREENGETIIKFHHAGFGNVPDDMKKGMVTGWNYIIDHARQRAEK